MTALPCEDPRILFIESDDAYAFEMTDALLAARDAYEVRIASSLVRASAVLAASDFDVVVVDLHMAQLRMCTPMVRRLRNLSSAPLLVLANEVESGDLKAMLEAGATDVVEKTTEGKAGVVQAIEVALERHRTLVRLRTQAFRDPLTGLPNRHAFVQRLRFAVQQLGERGQLALLLLDLDAFKTINDRLGHAAGDSVIVRVARRIRAVAASCEVGRLGGDEFAILVTPAESLERTLGFAEGLARTLRAPMRIHGHEVRVGCRIGVAYRPASAMRADALVAAADKAMYAAKRGGGTVRVWLPGGSPLWAASNPALNAPVDAG